MDDKPGMTPTPEVLNAAASPEPAPPTLVGNLIAQAERTRSRVIEALAPEDSNLVQHARRELEAIGELGEGGAYGGMVGKAALELITILAAQGHSGGSVGMTLAMFERLARFDVLSPITAHPSEWIDRSEYRPDGRREWQNRRKPSVFWREGEETWFDLDAPKEA